MGQDRQKKVAVERVLVKESPGEVRSDKTGREKPAGACHHCWFP